MSSGIDEELAGTGTSNREPITSKIIRWRNWSLAVKLAAVVLVPVMFALVLGILQISGQIHRADEYAYLDDVASTAGTVRTTARTLQAERTGVAEFLSRGPIKADALRERFTATDRAVDRTEPALDSNAPGKTTVTSARAQFQAQFKAIGDLRNQVLTRSTDPHSAIRAYNEIVTSLLSLDRALIGEISSTELGSVASMLHELERIGQEMRLQQAWVLVGGLRPEFGSTSTAELNASEIRRRAATEEFRASAPPKQRQKYDRLYLEPAFSARENSLRLAMDEDGGERGSALSSLVPAHVWEGQSRAALSSLNELQEHMEQQQHRTAFALQDNASNLAGLESVLLLSALLAAGAVVAVFTRQLHGSLETLWHSALDTANYQLPTALATVRDGNGSQVAIGRVPVDTTEEVGQVARAFDDVHTQAINLAAEQAELRKSYSDSFVNISRRSQSLLERQLRLFEQLERDEEDPDQLATLFQLDHLATRMRRNNENLMVLSGTDLTRRFTRPVPPADLVRAAISEIEHYPRVIVQPLPDAQIVGYVASDLVRLVAELLDNAANFSAPDTTVTVSGYRRDDGSIEINIVDRGIGMHEAELDMANQRLMADREPELSTSRRMGLFVVARLAHRHGIDVQLHSGPAKSGVHVTIGLRPELMLYAMRPPVPPHTNGATRPDAVDPCSLEDTLVHEINWQPANHGGAPPVPTRNGFHLLDTAPRHGFDTRYEQRQHQQDRAEVPPDHKSLAAAEQYRNGMSIGSDDATIPTPIFDNLASAWFQSREQHRAAPQPPHQEDVRWPSRSADDDYRTPPGEAGNHEVPPDSGSPPTTGSEQPADGWESIGWRFTSDEARLHAEEVYNAEPTAYNSVGLPVRVPRANLVAGSVDTNGSLASAPNRDAKRTRQRMSSFQQGLRRGRHRDEETSTVAADDTSQSVVDDAGPATDWLLNTDAAAEQVQAALEREPESYTSAGLPRRTPRAQLTPGGADDTCPGADSYPAEGPHRNADQMRGRLSDFQRGVQEGKHSLRDPSEDL